MMGAAHLKEQESCLERERRRHETQFSYCRGLAVSPAVALAQSQQTTDVELIRGANRQLAAAIGARDIDAMDKVWAHETYATFIGPLSTTVVVGWSGVRKAWQMRFGQFDRVTISMDDPHIRINGHAAWAVGMEKVELLRKDGKTVRRMLSLRMSSRTRAGNGCWSRINRRRSSRHPNSHAPGDLLSMMRTPERSIALVRSISASVR
jgi:ketosteroid isomerase-like protein